MSTLSIEEHVLPLDIVGSALRGPHRHLAIGGDGPVLRYPPEIAAFTSLGTEAPDASAWEALTALPGDTVALIGDEPFDPPATWATVRDLPVTLMAGSGADPDIEPDPEVVALDDKDVPAMLDLVARTAPGPLLPRTIGLGGYVGIRRDGALVAMAGRRMHPPGWIEVSAVCTDPAHRGAGFARKLITAVVSGIRADGAQPFLHVLPTNPALKLYESLGFEVVRERHITGLQRVG